MTRITAKTSDGPVVARVILQDELRRLVLSADGVLRIEQVNGSDAMGQPRWWPEYPNTSTHHTLEWLMEKVANARKIEMEEVPSPE